MAERGRELLLRADPKAHPEIRRGPTGLTVTVGGGSGAGTLLLVGYDRLHRTSVGRGENAGRTLEEANIVRSMAVLGA